MSNVWNPNGSSGIEFPTAGNFISGGKVLEVTHKNVTWGPISGGSFLSQQGGITDTSREWACLRFDGVIQIWMGGVANFIGGIEDDRVIENAELRFVADYGNQTIDIQVNGKSVLGGGLPANVGVSRLDGANFHIGCTSSNDTASPGIATPFELANRVGRTTVKLNNTLVIDTIMNPAGYTGTVVPNSGTAGDGVLVSGTLDGSDWDEVEDATVRRKVWYRKNGKLKFYWSKRPNY